MKKYLISKDYKAEVKSGFKFTLIEAATLAEAMIEADIMWNDDDTYMMHIFTKSGKSERVERGIKSEMYEAVIARRSKGWHPNTEAYSESPFKVKRTFTSNNDWEYFDIVI